MFLEFVLSIAVYFNSSPTLGRTSFNPILVYILMDPSELCPSCMTSVILQFMVEYYHEIDRLSEHVALC